MTIQHKEIGLENSLVTHQYYMEIINCMPNIVYWVDLDCMLKGCNINFVRWLGLKQLKDFAGTPYEQMVNRLPWSAERIESLRLDDMAVLFSGLPQYDVEEAPAYNKEGEAHYYSSSRVPLLNADRQVIGMVVILTDITHLKAMQKEQGSRALECVHLEAVSHMDKPLRILIVEDNLIAQSVEKALLVALNCNVDIADSGNAAGILFSPGKYDLVFMDIGLQDTSGYVVSKTFREMEKNTGYHVPIIALTSYQADVIKSDCRDYFMDGVMTKPLTRQQAIQLINHYVYHDDVEIEAGELAAI